MSHCTSFKFQYTNRKLIEKSYEDLGLEWSDDIVNSYASSYDKEHGIVSNRQKAIIACKNGFNYFMCQTDDGYELSIEKHDMTYSEEKIARRMGNEFQRLYLKNAAQEVVNQMQSKGQNCILDETANGFEIRFGGFYEKSLLVKITNGRVEERVQGVKGGACRSLTETFEKLLASPDVALNTEWTSEYYEPSEGGLFVYDLNM